MLARFFVILFAAIAAGLAAGFTIAIAVVIPEVGDLALDPLERSMLGFAVAFGAIFFSFFALLPAIIVIVLGESLGMRSVLYYAAAGAVVAALAYMSSNGWTTLALTVDGFARRELEVMTGAGIVAGFVYWALAGRRAGRWREPPQGQKPDPS